MKADDYHEALKQSSLDNQWKTAYNVKLEDFPKLTRRLRYQASLLNLDVKIQTDKQQHTVSFIAQRRSK